MSNPLDAIIGWYEVAIDSMRIAERVIRKEMRGAVLEKHTFFAEPIDASIKRIEAAKGQVNDLVVLNLVASFERFIRDYLSNSPRIAPPPADGVDDGLRRRILSDMEHWKLVAEVLPLFAGSVDSKINGRVKQAIDYRNWIAHGRSTAKSPDANMTPQSAYEVLSRFLLQAGLLV